MTRSPTKVLLFEDDSGGSDFVKRLLGEDSREAIQLTTAPRFREGLSKIASSDPDIILVDRNLIDRVGTESVREVNSEYPAIPMIVLTDHDDDELALAAMKAGAQDFIVKGTDAADLTRQIKHSIARNRLLSRETSETEGGHGTRDYHDSLTGLPNCSLFRDRLQNTIKQAERSGSEVGILSVDLDDFRNLNERLGQQIGDIVLQETAERIKATVRASDTVARADSDRFQVVLVGINSSEDAGLVARKILRSLNRGFLVQDQKFFMTASIGISVFPRDGGDLDDLMQKADRALLEAKTDGKNCYRLHHKSISSLFNCVLSLEKSLHLAVEKGEFVAYFQPQVELFSGEITGLEALVRWQHPEFGLMLPRNFIPVAKETGVIAPIDLWVLKSACEQTRRLQDLGFVNLRIAVNLSALQFRKKSLPETIFGILEETELNPSSLCLEVTEIDVMQDAQQAVQLLGELKALGVQLSVDDFGRGSSSLNHIERFPIDMLKVDRDFVTGIPENQHLRATTTAIVALAHSLGLKVVAEGLETVEQLEFLRALECDEMQGFYFSRPLRADSLAALLRSGKRLALSEVQII